MKMRMKKPAYSLNKKHSVLTHWNVWDCSFNIGEKISIIDSLPLYSEVMVPAAV